MNFWDDVWQWLGFGNRAEDGHGGIQHESCINPANGLPMAGGCGGVDIEGNPYGADEHTWGGSSVDTGWHNDSWGGDSGFGGWDD
jgi:hypothetical protein